ncbi:MAG: 50S ribosomal protein L17 [Candidatus Aminicenantes bacterium]|jgi:large subunit ribosomal protein L17|nr:50S ribosomal protein L17 [Candidatus Aminicenantes bacterium]TFG80398.1 MAG: 50S ribosomal protein L17 [Chrysiogenales bacterium]
MRHAKDGYKLRRSPAHRRALLRNLTASVVEKNRVTTTLTKAKAVQPIVEKMVGLGKAGTLADKRRALAYFFTRQTVQKLFDEVAPRFMDRQGGYTRIIRGDFRKGDGAETAIIEFVDYQFVAKDKKKKDKKAAKK